MTAEMLTLEEAAVWLRFIKKEEDGTETLDTARLIRISTGPRPKVASLKTGRVRTYQLESLRAFVEANETAAAPPNTWNLNDASARRIRRAG